MATLKWATPASRTADISDGELEGLSDGQTTGHMYYDNRSNKYLFAAVSVYIDDGLLWTPGSDPYLTLRVQAEDDTNTPDVGSGDLYRLDVEEGAGTKILGINKIRLYPFELLFYITNNTGAAFPEYTALHITPYNESSS